MRRITAIGKIHRKPADRLDRYGNPVSVPVAQWKTEDLPVFSIQPSPPVEEFAGGRVAVERHVRVSAPLSAPIPGVDDLVSLPGSWSEGGLFMVVGEVERWETNPILPVTLHGGMVIRLVRYRR
ncbi:hypothetical protein [Trueperella sp. LYQ141]|uniref:hypothetical protein n=1 Tax=Trueperella sp. LYQ141 TaxID=3391058 RepID=UPI0039830EB5